MKGELVRFGVAMEQSLLSDLDAIVEARGVTRSELLRDLVRAEVVRARAPKGVPAVGTLTLVYDHHVRELTERLTEFQHKLGEQVRADAAHPPRPGPVPRGDRAARPERRAADGRGADARHAGRHPRRLRRS